MTHDSLDILEKDLTTSQRLSLKVILQGMDSLEEFTDAITIVNLEEVLEIIETTIANLQKKERLKKFELEDLSEAQKLRRAIKTVLWYFKGPNLLTD